MNNILKIQERCVGCRSCEQSCPKHCISFVEDKEGFLYPEVDDKKCIECKICLKVCPCENAKLHRSTPKKVWAWKSTKSADVMRSASGGAADSAAKTVLEMNGVVYGAAYDEKFVVSHIEVTDDEDRKKIQSSKYVQSDLKDCYTKIKKWLTQNRKVLFTGCPCQVAGLYAFLGGDKNNLYTIDLICHGVPSPKFLKRYLEYQSEKNGGQVNYLNFRSKDKKGWSTRIKIKTKKKTMEMPLVLDRYGKHFMEGDCYRESCYQCEFANINRVGDITVGDFWGIIKSHPHFYSAKGVSSVFVNTIKGQWLFQNMENQADTENATLEECLVGQENLTKSSIRPVNRDWFYEMIDAEGFIQNLKVGLQLKEKIKSILPAGLVRILKRCVMLI